MLIDAQYHSVDTMKDTDITALIKRRAIINIVIYVITIVLLVIYYFNTDKFARELIKKINNKVETSNDIHNKKQKQNKTKQNNSRINNKKKKNK
ncbi:hypothetical protein PIROE2DRAFT_13438 [Piromyces sp. E2]|nr:hypothetical protein PIROE2DRAFT_13438 [Piromyces sp. E2]|eukprot:OUM60710.1 hypothetical protein PIROE2DRAFT_13438 [Piromyces sp. E2]